MSAQLSCGGSMMKCFLFIFNFVFWLCGAGMLGVGIWLMVDENVNEYLEIVYYDENDYLVQAATYTLLAAGSFIILVSFFGCCGAWQQSSWMLSVYAFLCVICLLAELAIAILAVVFKDEISKTLEDEMTKQAENYVKNEYEDTDALTLGWHSMQTDFECCGSTSYKDYENNPYFNATYPVPLTCCKLTNSDSTDPKPVNEEECYAEYFSGNATSTFEQLHQQGCHEEFYNWLDERLWVLIGVGFGVAFIQLMGVVFACALRKELSGDVDF